MPGVKTRLKKILAFLSSQGIAMGGNLAYGLLCVRLLPIASYAKYTILFSFLGTLTVLLDVGVSSTLAPLVADRVHDRSLIASYLNAIRDLALRVYLVLTPVALIIFFMLLKRQSWSAGTMIGLGAALSLAAWFARVSASYGAALLLLRERKQYYKVQLAGSIGSLSFLLVFILARRLSLTVAIFGNLLQIILMAALYYRRARNLLPLEVAGSKERQTQIVRLALPNTPSTIFYALQGQISVFLMSFFGRNVGSVASVGALGRLGQIFALFSQVNIIFFEPYFARLPKRELKTKLSWMAMGVSGFAAFITALAFLAPSVFLWILGNKYSALKDLVWVVILSASIRFVSGFLWTFNSSRRFVYLAVNIGMVVSTVLIQIFYISFRDLTKISGILQLNVATGIGELLIIALGTVAGFKFGPKKLPGFEGAGRRENNPAI